MNKKKIFGFLAVMVIAAGAAWNVNLNSQKSDLSDISLVNVEVLAQEIVQPQPSYDKYTRRDWPILNGSGATIGHRICCDIPGYATNCTSQGC
jgi:hypothetical protein